jgi:hypothetical protein
MGRLENEFSSTNLNKDTKDLFKGLSEPKIQEGEDKNLLPNLNDLSDPTILAVTQAIQDNAIKAGIQKEADITAEQVQRTTQQDIADMDESQLRLMSLMNQFFPEEEGVPAIERLSTKELFPTLGEPIQVGTVGGKVIGSQPIFVAPSATFPISIVHARRRALEDAAKKKATARKKVFDSAFVKTPEQLQRQMDNISMNFVEKWSRITNNKLDLLLDPTNPIARQFHNELRGLQTIGVELLDLDKTADDIEKQSRDLENFVPIGILRHVKEFQEGALNLQEYIKKPERYNANRNMMKSYASMVNAVTKQVLPNLQTDIDRAINEMDGGEIKKLFDNFDASIYQTVLKEHVRPERINQLAKDLKTEFNLFQSEGDIKDHIYARMGEQLKTSNIAIRKWHDFTSGKAAKDMTMNWSSGGVFTIVNEENGQVTSLESVRFVDFAGVQNVPKNINIKPSQIIDVGKGTGGTPAEAFNVDVLQVREFWWNPKKRTISVEAGSGGKVPTDETIEKLGLKKKTFVVGISREGKDIEYKGSQTGKPFKLKARGTFLVPYDDVKRPLENSGFKVTDDAILIQGREIPFTEAERQAATTAIRIEQATAEGLTQ